MPEMKTPGPDHALSVHRSARRVEALFHGHIIADSARAMLLKEADLPDAWYFPIEDVAMEFLQREDHAEHCNYKGDRIYWRIFRDGKFAEHGAWSYPNPYPAADDLREMITFDADWVTIHVDEHAEDRIFAASDEIGEYIRHTDSGSGRSQESPWPANVRRPDPESGEIEDDTRTP